MMTSGTIPTYRLLAAAIILLQGGPPLARAMIAYDCNHPNVTHMSIDLVQPEPWPDPDRDYEPPRKQRVQILQTASALPVQATQCLIAISKKVTRCGFDSLTYGSKWTVWQMAYEVTPKECREAATRGTIKVEGRPYKVVPNTKAAHRFYSQGSLDNEMNCYHVSGFKSGEHYFTKSYEETLVEITIKVIRGTADTATGQVLFQNNIRANYKDEVARDVLEGTMVWVAEEPECQDTVSELYQGLSLLYRRREENLLESIIIVRNNATDQFAGLVLKAVTSLCRVRCYETQVKGLFVCPFREGDEPLPPRAFKDHMSPDRIDLQTQLGYLHTTTNLATADRFALVQTELCRVARRTLYNKLQAISGAHNVYSLLDIYGPGHMVYQAGAAAYVTKCVGIEVTRAEFQNCTHEIPVVASNKTRFADPLTLVLTDYPTIIPCSDLMPPRWKMGDEWYCSHPRVLPCSPPQQLNLTVTPFSQLHYFTHGMGEGIYSSEQKEQHRRFQVAQMSRRPVMAKITNAAAMQGHGTNLGSTLNDLDVKELSIDIAYHLFPLIYCLGEAWKYISTFLLIALIFKVIGGAVIRAAVTYRRKGCGRWVVFSLWETLFIVVSTPWRLVAQTAEAMTAPLRETDDGYEQPDSGHQKGLHHHPDFMELSHQVQQLKVALAQEGNPLEAPIVQDTSVAAPSEPSSVEVPSSSAPTAPTVSDPLLVHMPLSRLFPK